MTNTRFQWQTNSKNFAKKELLTMNVYIYFPFLLYRHRAILLHLYKTVLYVPQDGFIAAKMSNISNKKTAKTENVEASEEGIQARKTIICLCSLLEAYWELQDLCRQSLGSALFFSKLALHDLEHVISWHHKLHAFPTKNTDTISAKWHFSNSRTIQCYHLLIKIGHPKKILKNKVSN